MEISSILRNLIVSALYRDKWKLRYEL